MRGASTTRRGRAAGGAPTALALAVLSLAFAGCKKGDGVVLVSISAEDAAPILGIISLRATASVGGQTRSFDVPTSGQAFDIPPVKSFGLAIPSSLSGTLAVHVDARDADGNLVGSGDGGTPFATGTSGKLTVVLMPTGVVPGTDMASFDAGPVIAPRLIAPLSTATVTARRPKLRWVMPGAGAPVVDLCRDRACSLPLGVAVTLDAGGGSGVPNMDLPSGPLFWRVRAVGAGMDLPSYTWEFFVGARAAPGGVDASVGTILDVNGDGFADLATTSAAGGGRVWVMLGGSAGPAPLGSPLVQEIDNPDAPTPGWATDVAAAGDVNGDGYGDVIVGGPKVRIYYGSSNGLHPSLATSVQTIDNPDTNNTWGQPVAGAGDVNGDGYADVMVAAATTKIGGTGGVGRVHLFFGSAAGVQPTDAARHQDLDGIDVAQSEFGDGIGATDVNADGYSDILVGAPFGGSNQEGRVRIYLGSAAGVQPGAVNKVVDIVGTDGFQSLYGGTISAADINGDGYGDFIVGAWSTKVGANDGAGRLHVYLGSAAGITPSVPSSIITIDGSDGVGGNFGLALSGGGDIDGDGFQEMAVAGGTKVYVYFGSATGFKPTPTIITNPDGVASGFGVPVGGLGDTNGDGFADLAAGSPNVTTGTGRVHVYLGAAVGLQPTTNGRFITFDGPDGTNARFGASIAH